MKKKINIIKNGPYKVSGKIPLSIETLVRNEKGESIGWEKEKTYNIKENEYYLCRCGHSKNFPFCDETHKNINFDGTETADKTPYEEAANCYKGETMDLLDIEELCASVHICMTHGSTWQLIQSSSDPSDREIAIKHVANCPSGRLVAKNKDGTVIEPDLEPEITVIKDPVKCTTGPLWVKGNIPVSGAENEDYEVRNRQTLCCCGESSNMPFCDRTHFNCKHAKRDL